MIRTTAFAAALLLGSGLAYGQQGMEHCTWIVNGHCVLGTPRMSYEESSAIKREMLREMGKGYKPRAYTSFCAHLDMSPCTVADFELDHIVSLALGGTNDRSNLCLQPWPEAREKDRLELELIRRVRARAMPVEQAQAMLHKWREAYQQTFGEPAYAGEAGHAQRAREGSHPNLECD